MNEAKINEIISFLNNYDQPKLEYLRKKHPDYSKILAKGIPLGKKKDAKEKEEYKVRLEVAKFGLETGIKESKLKFDKISTRLKRLKKIQFFSEIISIVGASAILLLLRIQFLKDFQWIIYIAPSIILLTALTSIFIRNKIKSFVKGEDDIYVVATKLNNSIAEGKHLLEEVHILTNHFSIEKVKPIVSMVSKLVLNIRKTLPLIE